MRRLGLVHGGTNLASDGDVFRIDMADLTGGSTVMVYGQQEVMKDLFDAAEQRDVQIVFDARGRPPQDVDSDRPFVTWREDGVEHRLDCDFIAGCDGYHGVSRAAIPADVLKTFERVYPFGWLGILADVPPCDRRADLFQPRARLRPGLDALAHPQPLLHPVLPGRSIEDWSDERFWDELCLRLGPEAASPR
jgi:p-hydroxybenzoate 3-monooxygenase